MRTPRVRWVATRMLFVVVALCVPPSRAVADLTNERVLSDDPLQHSAVVDDRTLSRAKVDRRTPNWSWEVEQRPFGTNLWIIQIRARHTVGPHGRDASAGEELVVTLFDVTPGGTEEREAVAAIPHPGRRHWDYLVAKYEPVGPGLSKLGFTLYHESGEIRIPFAGRSFGILVPIIVVLVSIAVGVVVGGLYVRLRSRGS